MSRLGAGGRTKAAVMILLATVSACGQGPPPSASSPAPSPRPQVALKATGNLDEPLPPSSFDPASLPAFSYATGDGLVGVWSGPIGRPDLATPFVDPIPESDGAYGIATRVAEGSVVVPFAAGDSSRLLLIRDGSDPRVLVEDVYGPPGIAQGIGSLVVARTANLEDDGIWQVWLDGRDPVQVLPPVSRPELAGREGLALSADGRSAAAAACAGDVQVRWPGQEPTRLPFGIPLGFDASGALIAHRDCARGTILRIEAGTETGEPLVPEESGYQAVVTPAGGVLAAVHPGALPGKLLLLELGARRQRSVPLADGGWDFTSDTTDRYVVLRRDDGGFQGLPRFTWAVHDLVEGWTGYFVVDTYPPAP